MGRDSEDRLQSMLQERYVGPPAAQEPELLEHAVGRLKVLRKLRRHRTAALPGVKTAVLRLSWRAQPSFDQSDQGTRKVGASSAPGRHRLDPLRAQAVRELLHLCT